MSSGRSGIGVNFTFGSGEGTPAADGPFRILLLGDFTGRGSRGESSSNRKPVRVDRDNQEQVLERMGVEIHLDLEGQILAIPIKEMEDFEPDQLYENLELFQTMRNLRDRLENPSTFADAAKQLVGDSAKPKAEPKPAPESKPADGGSGSGDLLDDILSQTKSDTPSQSRSLIAGVDWKDYLREIVAPHLAPNIDESQQTKLVDQMDTTITAEMRKVLHDPHFKEVESLWRGLDLLVRRVDTDDKVPLFVLDMTKEEFAQDLAGGDVSRSSLYKLLVDDALSSASPKPWALVVGLYTFGPEEDEVVLLSKMADVCARSGAPFVAAAHDTCLGIESVADSPDSREWPKEIATDPAWEPLRARAESSHIGLVLPRMMLRRPYGRDGTSTERFSFEELESTPDHNGFLWGNSAFGVALLLALNYEVRGWDFSRVLQEIDNMPIHFYEEDGDKVAKPCAEALLNDRDAGAILERGLMPMLSVKGRDAVFLMKLQSLAKPSRPLTGRWQL